MCETLCSHPKVDEHEIRVTEVLYVEEKAVAPQTRCHVHTAQAACYQGRSVGIHAVPNMGQGVNWQV